MKGVVLCMFSKHDGVQDSIEAVVMLILKALWIFSSSYEDNLIIESDSSNVISWMASKDSRRRNSVPF